MSTTKFTLPDGSEGVADIVEAPSPTFGKGSQAAVAGLATNAIALIFAALDAGADFYNEPGVLTLIGTFVAGCIAFFGGRSSQANRLVEQATAITRSINAKAELAIAAYEVELAKNDAPVVTQPPAPPVEEPQPPVDPEQTDQGSAGPGTVG